MKGESLISTMLTWKDKNPTQKIREEKQRRSQTLSHVGRELCCLIWSLDA